MFKEKIEIKEPRRIPQERCKGVHCVDLGESFSTSIYLQNVASIQPRTRPKKFESSSSREFEFLLNFKIVNLLFAAQRDRFGFIIVANAEHLVGFFDGDPE